MTSSPELPDFDDEPTIIQVRSDDVAEPPPLPFPLRRARDGDKGWLDELPDEARAILEAARWPAESWPRGPRLAGAVAVPRSPIPSLLRQTP